MSTGVRALGFWIYFLIHGDYMQSISYTHTCIHTLTRKQHSLANRYQQIEVFAKSRVLFDSRIIHSVFCTKSNKLMEGENQINGIRQTKDSKKEIKLFYKRSRLYFSLQGIVKDWTDNFIWQTLIASTTKIQSAKLWARALVKDWRVCANLVFQLKAAAERINDNEENTQCAHNGIERDWRKNAHHADVYRE